MGSLLFSSRQGSAQMKIGSLCPSFMTHKFKLAEFYAVGSKDKVSSLKYYFFFIKRDDDEGKCTCNTLPLHGHFCVPTLTVLTVLLTWDLSLVYHLLLLFYIHLPSTIQHLPQHHHHRYYHYHYHHYYHRPPSRSWSSSSLLSSPSLSSSSSLSLSSLSLTTLPPTRNRWLSGRGRQYIKSNNSY